MYRQAAPFCVQVEATEGCNLRCVFCGLNGIRGPNVRSTDRYMTVETARTIAASMAHAKWNSRIEFAMHGEPTLNPYLADLILAFRTELPHASIMLTTNGVPLTKPAEDFNDKVEKLFAYGLNMLALDNYAGLQVAPLMRQFAQRHRFPQYEYPTQVDGNPNKRHDWRLRAVTVVQDISQATMGTHAHLSNHAGAAAPRNDSMAGQRCALPFRELSVRWDGNVALCCNDWRGVFKVGNVNERSVEHIWHDPAMYAARKHLLAGERTFAPCQGCDHRSYRPGLLPDQLGKETYPPADETDDRWITQATSGAPYTLPVLRPWEGKVQS